MPRKPRERQLAKSLIFHVLNRGVLKQIIFHDDDDFATFFNAVCRYARQAGVGVYHWCLMHNHYHLVLEIPKPTVLSKIVGGWQQVYARKYHRRYGTAGKLFQGRFKSQAIEKENYLLTCGRYVEQNPMRAGICQKPWEWGWSSARFYVEGGDDGLTTCDPLWVSQDREAYMRWIEERSEEQERLFASAADIIGGEAFVSSLIRKKGRAVLRRRGRKRGREK